MLLPVERGRVMEWRILEDARGHKRMHVDKRGCKRIHEDLMGDFRIQEDRIL